MSEKNEEISWDFVGVQFDRMVSKGTVSIPPAGSCRS